MTRHQVGEDVIAALAIHRGDSRARRVVGHRSQRCSRQAAPEQAVFWLALLRGREGAGNRHERHVQRFGCEMLRKHAAFAVWALSTIAAGGLPISLGSR